MVILWIESPVDWTTKSICMCMHLPFKYFLIPPIHIYIFFGHPAGRFEENFEHVRQAASESVRRTAADRAVTDGLLPHVLHHGGELRLNSCYINPTWRSFVWSNVIRIQHGGEFRLILCYRYMDPTWRRANCLILCYMDPTWRRVLFDIDVTWIQHGEFPFDRM